MDQLTFNYSYDEKISNSKPYKSRGQTLIIVVFEQTYAF